MWTCYLSTPSTVEALLLVLKNRLEFLILLYERESLSQSTILLKYSFSNTGFNLEETNFFICSIVVTTVTFVIFIYGLDYILTQLFGVELSALLLSI